MVEQPIPRPVLEIPPPVAPPDRPMTARQRLWLVTLVVLKRVRFIAILAFVGLFIGYWDTVANYWEKWTHPRSVAARELGPGQEFYCPMHPQVIRLSYEPNGDVPNCPICGMPLSARATGEATRLPAGVTGRVQLSPERVQLAGIKTARVERRPMAHQTQTVGYIAFDETRLSRIVSRVEGYVEKLYVDNTFAVVHQGDPLAEIYSPQLYSTAKELLLASRGTGLPDLAASARTKLLLLGISPQEIDGIVSSGQPSARLVIRSPQTGYVIDKKIVVGSSVDAKMTLFEVADLSKVWIEADVFEKDIPFLQAGQPVEAVVEAWPNRTFTGRLALVYPELDPATRTNRVRMELDNPGSELRPGMFARVQIRTPLESVEPFKSAVAKAGQVKLTGLGGESSRPGFLAVPERAVVDTGAKQVVYVEREPGVFEGVEVQLGPRQGDYYPVLRGLNPGDKVAAAGGFLIDAETRLNPAAASTYFGASGSPQSGGNLAPPPTPGRQQGDPARMDQGAPHPREADSKPQAAAVLTAAQREKIEELPEADRPLALAQRVCPITDAPLGSMGVPVKITLRGRPVFLCCPGCIGKARRAPDETLRKVAETSQSAGAATPAHK